jgi:uncharacterized membrane protein YjgN (DUF898 family)
MHTPPTPPEDSVELAAQGPVDQASDPSASSTIERRSASGPRQPVSRAQSRQFAFDGGAASYIGTGILAFLITVFTLGICYPFAFVLRERWRAKHSFIDGRQLIFAGSAVGLFGHWLKWFVLIIITLGIYSFWVGPRLYRWKWENTAWAAPVRSGPAAP